MTDELTRPGTPALWEKARLIAKQLEAPGEKVRLISHYDCDGLTASAILAKALGRASIPFQLTNVTGLGQDLITDLKGEQTARVLFSDLGSGQRELLGQLTESMVMVVDHHLGQGEGPSNVLELNAHEVGVDGTFEACTATLALVVALSLSQKNWDLVQIALMGMIGDRQHLPHLRGLNQQLVSEGMTRGYLTPSAGLAFDSEVSLTRALTGSLDPYLVGLAGRPEATAEYLEGLGLDPSSTLGSLSIPQQRNLGSQLLIKLLGQGATPEATERLFFPFYQMRDYPLEASLLSKAIDSAGREGQKGLGVAAAMGDRDALQEVAGLLGEFQDRLRQGLLHLEQKGPTASPQGTFAYFFRKDPTIKGSMAGIGSAYWLCKERPLLSFTHNGSKLDVSARGSQGLISKGLDLAAALSTAAKSCEGQGGGHPIASGATVAAENEARFIAALDDVLGSQGYL